MTDTERLEHARAYLKMEEDARKRMIIHAPDRPDDSLAATMAWLIAKAEACQRAEELAAAWDEEASEIFEQNTQPFSAVYIKALDRCVERLVVALADQREGEGETE